MMSMSKFIIGMMLIFILLSGCVWAAQAEETNSPSQPQGRMKPPPEAIAACKEKSEGDAVQFTTPRGDMLKGICRKFEGVLAAMPEHGAPPSKGNKPDESNSGQSGN